MLLGAWGAASSSCPIDLLQSSRDQTGRALPPLKGLLFVQPIILSLQLLYLFLEQSVAGQLLLGLGKQLLLLGNLGA